MRAIGRSCGGPCSTTALDDAQLRTPRYLRELEERRTVILAAGKNTAGGRDDTPDFYGLVTAICVAPLNAPARPDALQMRG
jgi:hypothetical protein